MNQIRSRLYHRKSREEMAGVAKHTIDEDVVSMKKACSVCSYYRYRLGNCM